MKWSAGAEGGKASRNEQQLCGCGRFREQARSKTSGMSVEVARPPVEVDIDHNGRVLQRYLELGYTAISHALIDRWMSEMSGTEFKVAVLFLRRTIGDRDKRASADLRLGMTLAEMQTRTGADREAVVRAVRDLEAKGLIAAQRAHRKTTVYDLQLEVLLGSSVWKPDPGASIEPGIPTPYKEIKKAAADCFRCEAEQEIRALTEPEWAEVRRIGAGLGVQIDGKNAMALKRAAEQADLTLSHLRWFLRDETFSGARNRIAVLLAIAREFPERSKGINWPPNLNLGAQDLGTQVSVRRGLKAGEIE